MTRIYTALFVLIAFAVVPVTADAGQSAPAASGTAAASAVAGVQLPFTYDGPAPPALPETMVRDADGRTTVRAIRLDVPLRIDGQLDEALYQTVTPITDFIQAEPRPGTEATEKTEVWIAFDDDNVYVSVRAGESQPERMVINEMRRDSSSTWQNENFGFSFDTFYDRRNSVNFQFTPIGGWADGQNTNEGQYNGDWNPIWTFKVRRTDHGWTGEAAIPFKSLRYRPGRAQIWGVQLRRINRWKNENSYLTRLPNGVGANGSGSMRTSRFATLVGIEAPPGARALDIKPYVTSSLATDRTVTPRIQNAFGRDFGFDGKYGITQNLTADFTYNTDFAQVEADEQQVNLTRFSLFFPEKRDFFIENQGLFNFGGVTGGNTGDAPVMFYSRRIGLDRGGLIPIDGGGRVTGRVGRVSVGLVNMQTDNEARLGVPSTNFSVARVRRDILRRSAIGALVTRRSTTVGGAGSAETFGLDGTFAFFSNLTIQTYWAKTQTPGLSGDDESYRANLEYNGDRYGLTLAHLRVGDNFLPEVGFVRRDNLRKHFVTTRFSPRLRSSKVIRKLASEGQMTYVENGRTGIVESRNAHGEFRVEFLNSDSLEVSYDKGYELLPAVFRIARGVNIPVGGYDLSTARAQFTLGQQRPASGTVYAEHGEFYLGDRTAFGYSGARVKVKPQLAVEPGISVNRVTLPFGSFTTKLVSSRVTYTVTPRMFVSGLTQFNSSNNSLSSNVRMRWEYAPGSELFVVYNESRDTLPTGYPDLQGRTIVVKVNRLLRF